MIGIEAYLLLSAITFVIGVVGVVTRRNAIIVFMSIELMLNSVNLTLVAFSAYLGDATGQMLVFFCDDGRCSGSSGGTCNHHCALPQQADGEYR